MELSINVYEDEQIILIKTVIFNCFVNYESILMYLIVFENKLRVQFCSSMCIFFDNIPWSMNCDSKQRHHRRIRVTALYQEFRHVDGKKSWQPFERPKDVCVRRELSTEFRCVCFREHRKSESSILMCLYFCVCVVLCCENIGIMRAYS